MRADLLGPREIVFVATRALKARHLTLKKGDPFPFQDRAMIRALGPAFGVPNADELPWSELDYVETVVFPVRG